MVGVNCFSLKAKFYEELITVVLWSLLFKLCVNLQLDLTFIDENKQMATKNHIPSSGEALDTWVTSNTVY